jgi:hypothetical protein
MFSQCYKHLWGYNLNNNGQFICLPLHHCCRINTTALLYIMTLNLFIQPLAEIRGFHGSEHSSQGLLSCYTMQCVIGPLKHWYPTTTLHGVTTQEDLCLQPPLVLWNSLKLQTLQQCVKPFLSRMSH